MFNKIFLEISGACNANCKWCITGRQKKAINNNLFMSLESCKAVVERLTENKLIGRQAVFPLYNWGEPTLNPEFAKILQYFNTTPYKFALSTNAGIIPKNLKREYFKNLSGLVISMPGFSPDSYKNIHGFKFKKVLRNIDQWIDLVGHKKVHLNFHIYKFNQNEIEPARTYFLKRYVRFTAYKAFLNGYSLMADYLKKKLDTQVSSEAENELIMDYWDELLASRPKDYHCSQFDFLTIDEKCNVLVCCGISKEHPDYYKLGTVFDMVPEDIIQEKRSLSICKECQRLAIDYFGHHPDVVISDPLPSPTK